LRWLWYNSDTKEKSWKNLLKVTYPIDRQFFFSSTIIHIGDGKTLLFGRPSGFREQPIKIWHPTCSKLLNLNLGQPTRSFIIVTGSLTW
jgi:hypothetical protein